MATFRVGQRVRLVRHANRSLRVPGASVIAIGTTGTIIEHDGNADWLGYMWEYDVCLDGDEQERRCCDGYQIEPIQPEGYKIVSWAECAWQPPKVTA